MKTVKSETSAPYYASDRSPVTSDNVDFYLAECKKIIEADFHSKPELTSASQAQNYIYFQLKDNPREEFHVLFLTTQNRVINFECMFQGTLNQAPVFPREIARACLSYNASSVILAHNHPSGDSEPSTADKTITECITETLSLIDVRVLDHFIVGKAKVYSFAEHGLL